MFNRKEHLTRHLKSHDPQRHDVLKRHVEQHSDGFNTTRALVACLSCHERKLKCDNGTPCRSCVRIGVECSRHSTTRESSDNAVPPVEHAAEKDVPMENAQAMILSFPDMHQSINQSPTVQDHPQTWLQDGQNLWFPQFPASSGLNAPLLSDASGFGPEQWPIGHAEGTQMGQVSVSFAEHEAFPMSTVNPTIVDLPALDRGLKTPSYSGSESPKPTSPLQSDQAKSLSEYLQREPMVTKRLLQLYFAQVHPHWPILHAPISNAAETSDVLIGAMTILALVIESNSEHVKLASMVIANLEQVLHVLVNVPTAEVIIGWFMSKCAAYAVLRTDTYLSALTGHPPSMHFHDIRIPLPKSSNVWDATTEDERRSLQWNEPVGREKALFCFLMSDLVDTSLHYRLTEADYHLTLCALQVNVWEVACEAHGCDRNEASAYEAINACSKRLDEWWANMEKDCLLRRRYFSGSAHSFPLTLILWHLSVLTLHAPMRLLQGQGCCSECRAGTAKNPAHVRAWTTSSNARIAVWNATQICRICMRESDRSTSAGRLLFNCLVNQALLRSAIVICAFAYHTRACPVCTGGPPIDLVDIFGAPDDDDRLVRWKGTGEGLADWVPLSIPVCQCRVAQLAKYLRPELAKDQGIDREFMSFL
ncbi:MAG: hypothetical protein Q9212_004136, partial [Teloschistes hypoglaucus]